MPTTEYLTESVAARIALSEQEAHELQQIGEHLAGRKIWWGQTVNSQDQLENKRSVIRCTRDDVPGFWNVTVRDAVGAVSIGAMDLIILPKIPMAHFLHLAAAGMGEPRFHSNAINLEAKDAFVDLVASWFVGALEDVLRTNLMCGYLEHRTDMIRIRGRILPRESIMNWQTGSLKMHCEYEEFDQDIPPNRLLLEAAKLVARNGRIAVEVRRRATRGISRMAHVGDFRPSDMKLSTRDVWPQYIPALKMAQQIILGQGRSLGGGTKASKTFLIKTPDLIEDGIREVLLRGLDDGFEIESKRRGIRIPQTNLTFTPDLLIHFDEFDPSWSRRLMRTRKTITGDVKYQIYSDGWDRDHLYQSIAFAKVFNSEGGLVVGFGNGQQGILPRDVAIGQSRYCLLAWQIGDQISPYDSESALILALKKWLATLSRQNVS